MKKENIKSGAVRDIPDARDYQWNEIGKSSAPFNWKEGFDIEDKLNFKIPVKSQGGSLSCGGSSFFLLCAGIRISSY